MPETLAAKINEWARGTMIAAHGTRVVSAGQDRSVARLDFEAERIRLTGLFHAGAIIALADETATAAAMWETNPTAEFRPELFPLTLPMSVNLIRNVNGGSLVAKAESVQRGRATLVVDVRVCDGRRQLLAKSVTTLLAPAPPAVTAPTDRPGR